MFLHTTGFLKVVVVDLYYFLIAFNVVARVRGPIPTLRNDGNVSTVKEQQSQRKNVLKWETAW